MLLACLFKLHIHPSFFSISPTKTCIFNEPNTASFFLLGIQMSLRCIQFFSSLSSFPLSYSEPVTSCSVLKLVLQKRRLLSSSSFHVLTSNFFSFLPLLLVLQFLFLWSQFNTEDRDLFSCKETFKTKKHCNLVKERVFKISSSLRALSLAGYQHYSWISARTKIITCNCIY